ncbi:MAG: DUF72 domain-containing protein [Spirochaetales bacterium]|nr:DUF72 domain-containing protein [Spirochaetales bacterium]
MSALRIGTSSWKFDSWEGILYEPGSPHSHLEQYADSFDTVEIDQWFWSLFESPQPRLPEPATAEEYARAVPTEFRFTIKVPNSITLTHHYQRDKSRPLRPNPDFLSRELFAEFLERIRPLHGRIGALILQFEYLNRHKMPGLPAFLEQLEGFVSPPPSPFPLAVESRNPNYLKGEYFRFLERHALAPCFLQGYYLPDVAAPVALWEAERAGSSTPGSLAVLRLHGPDREGMDRASGKRWDRILVPRDQEIERIADLIGGLLARKIDVYLNVNNHFEGSAPLTIDKLRASLEKR